MPIEAVKIPQNVYVEDRIIGPVTLKQLIIMGVGAGISYILYATVAQAGPPNMPITALLWSPTLIAAAFAFLKINDLSLFNIILLLIEHINKPSVRTWCPHPGISINIVTKEKLSANSEKKMEDVHAKKLEELTKKLDQQQAVLVSMLKGSEDAQKNQEQTVGKTAKESIDTITEEYPDENVEPFNRQQKKEKQTLTPVQPHRISVQGLHPQRSIDGLSDLKAYQHIFKIPQK